MRHFRPANYYMHTLLIRVWGGGGGHSGIHPKMFKVTGTFSSVIGHKIHQSNIRKPRLKYLWGHTHTSPF